MTTSRENVEDLEIRLLLEGIQARYGYDLRDYAPASMRRRVLLALQNSGLESLGALQHAALTDAAVFARVLDDLTVRVTELFRDPGFYRALREQVVPHLLTYPILRVWHSGCASGEEVYATAITFQEEGLTERTQVFASDVSATALDLAKQGVYPARQLGDATANYQSAGGTRAMADYCTEAYEQFAMSESLRRNVFFFHHDLVADDAFGEMQVVLCRNVLIYFNADLKRAVVRKLAASLRPGGFLCLGKGERLAPADEALGFVPFVSAERIYRFEPKGG